MKNKQITTLLKPVPKQIRLHVYKEALYLIENNTKHSALHSHCLCLLLPCIMWDLKSISDLLDLESGFTFLDTNKAFPELNNDIISEITDIYLIPSKNKVRIKYLKRFISELEGIKEPVYIRFYNYIKRIFK